jgi:hypothetical protein
MDEGAADFLSEAKGYRLKNLGPITLLKLKRKPAEEYQAKRPPHKKDAEVFCGQSN